MSTSPSPTQAVRLGDLLNAVSGLVQDNLGQPIWIQAEIVRAEARSKGYWILEVQDTDSNGKKIANASVMVWYREVPAVIYYFKRATGQDLGPGMKVLLQVKASFSPEWGFRLTAQAIDPSWTIGQLQQKITAIRENLVAAGIFTKNKELNSPRDFTKVAVVAPDMSAGLGDFWKEAKVLEVSGLCQFTVYKAAFEGSNATGEITRALALIVKAQPQEQYDAVLLMRGGGASTSIQTLNDELIVKSVCLCPIPVIVGIGHEKDQTLLDEVANISLGTPSKVAGLVVQTIVSNGLAARTAWAEIQYTVAGKLEEVRHGLDKYWEGIKQDRARILAQAREEIQNKWRQAVNLGPQATMERGYSIIRRGKQVIGSMVQLLQGQNPAGEVPDLQVWLQDGTVTGKLVIESQESGMAGEDNTKG